jgi:hypothetical protein
MGGEGGVAEGVAEGSRQDAAKEAEKALVAKEATQACEGVRRSSPSRCEGSPSRCEGEEKELPLSVGLRLAGRVDLTDGGRGSRAGVCMHLGYELHSNVVGSWAGPGVTNEH